jgi:hypothetical protein
VHKWISILLLFQVSSAQASLFGEENVPLFQLVVGQVQEIERLAELIGAAKNQVEAIKSLNAGINKTVDQIQAIEVIIDRAQGVDPTSIKSIAELNDYLERVQDVKARMDDLMGIRVKAAEIGITQSSIQGDTAYKMGQEMISTGSTLANESRNATPGRAAQISAASGSAQMVAKGVELQTMAQMVQLQALSLDLQRSQIDREMTARKMNQNLFINTLKSSSSRKLQ